MHNALAVDVSQGTAKLGHPKTDCIVCKCFARDVKAKITAIHQVDHDIAGSTVRGLERSRGGMYKQVFDVLKAVS